MKVESSIILNSNTSQRTSVDFKDAMFLESAFQSLYENESNIMESGPTIDIELGSLKNGIKIKSISTTYHLSKGVSVSSALSKYANSINIKDLYGDASSSNSTSQNDTDNKKDESLTVTIKPDGSVSVNNSSDSKPSNEISSSISSNNGTSDKLDLSPSKVNYSLSKKDVYDTTKVKPSKDEVIKLVDDIAPKYGLDPSLIKGFIQTESSFNHQSISYKGAVGLMQLMPDTARDLGLKVNDTIDERWDPAKNIEAGIKYIAYCRDKVISYVGYADTDLTIASYNAGPHNKLIKEGTIPESVKYYVKKVNRYCSEYK